MRIFFVAVVMLCVGLYGGWYAYEQLASKDAGKNLDAEYTYSELGEQSDPIEKNGVPNPHFEQFLTNKNIKSIKAAYLQITVSGDDDKIQAAHIFLSKEIQQAIKKQELSYAESLLELLLHQNHRDITALQLKAALKSEAGQTISALEALYEAKGYAITVNDIAQITRKVRETTDLYEVKLQKQENKYKLLELYRYLTQMEPDYSPYFIKLATMQLLNDDKISASRSLELISYDPTVGAQAQAMLNELQPEPIIAEQPEPVVDDIPLQRRGQHFIVSAIANESHRSNLLIDTGASLTIFTPRMFEKLKTSKRTSGRTAMFNTANGRVKAKIYTIDSLRIGGWQINDIEIGVMELATPDSIDGLLGMNYLRHFQFFIDQKSSALRLSSN